MARENLTRLSPLKALSEARRRIFDLVDTEGTALDLSGLPIRTIPEEISLLSNLTSLNLSDTNVDTIEKISSLENLSKLDLSNTSISDISSIYKLAKLADLNISNTALSDIKPLRHLSGLTYLDMDDTTVSDISSLSELNELSIFGADRTKIRDASPLSGLHNLIYISLDDTEVSDIEFVRELEYLEYLYLRNTSVENISPIEDLENLQVLELRGTRVEDFAPIRHLTSLSDARDQSRQSLRISPAKDRALSDYSNRDGRDGTVLAINLLRRRSGMGEYWPPDYQPPEDWPPEDAQPSSVDPSEDISTLGAPVPGPFIFNLAAGRVSASPAFGTPRTTTSIAAQQLLNGLREEAHAIASSLSGNRTDPALESAIQRLLDQIGVDAESTPIGFLQIGLRRFQALAAAYGSSDYEADRTVSGLLNGLALALEDFASLYPSVAEIEANRLALAFMDPADAEAVEQALDQAELLASSSSAVDPSATQALHAGREEIEALKVAIVLPIIGTDARAAAIRRRSEILGLRLLSLWNFGAVTVKAATHEISGLTEDSWKEIRKQTPPSVGKAVADTIGGAVQIGMAVLAVKLVGPLGGLVLSAPAFKVLLAKAKAVEKLLNEGSEKSEL
ncbi:hypothetical protein QO010_000096 [Caulobacter ginsengisoli]|uniref:Leucine-rich repeat domain-containing protein n=1 Tax=Caulobacter ginsengisoli TaxID=400775 RepID=A0ABU0IK12_9CAUL|nr:leucine-rich repeat domain-containing protein [Caulobacter ginsengisoli]MDQ0462348.1 hypothetical protein [Caulobacter ginsengisoli]